MKKIIFNKYLFCCVLLTIVGFGIIFGIQNIYPFGKHTIRMLDFDGGYIPVYYKLWDVLHFKSPLFFDWNLGAGLNSFGSLIGNGFVSPVCWIIGLFPRNSIPYTISYVYLAKMVLTSILTYVAISKILPKTKEKNKILFTLLYTFSGWTFLMSTNLLYLDAFSLFPLLVYSLKELLDKGHWKLYTILLTITLLLNYYIAWLDLLFIVGTTALYLIIMKPNRSKEKAVKVLVCTLFSLFLSCILFLPGFMLAKTSTRMANNTSNDGLFSYFMDKSIYLFTLAIPFVLTIKQLFVKKDKKLNIFIIAMLVYLLIGVVIEPINAMWHTGSHSGFPFRYAYQPTFVTILVSLYYLNNNAKFKEKTPFIRMIVPIFAIITAIVLFIGLYKNISNQSTFVNYMAGPEDYLFVLLLFILLIVTVIFTLRNDSKKAFILASLIVLVQTIIYGTFYLYQFKAETSVSSQRILDSLNLKNDGHNYVINLDTININFPYILKLPSIANRIHFIRQEFADEAKYMGFYTNDTTITSAGSNEFFNLLLQNKYYIVYYELPDSLYTLIEKNDSYSYYESKYNLNYLVPYNGNRYDREDLNIMENANNVYKELFGGTKNIYNKIDFAENNNKISINVKKGHIYYVLLDVIDLIDGSYSILNDNIKSMNWIVEDTGKNTNYYSFYATDDFSYNFYLNFKFDNLKVYELDNDELVKFANSQSKNEVDVSIKGGTKTYTYIAPKDTSVLLPINYDDNYIIRVNGKIVDYKCNLYNMLSIDVKKGKNVIEITYSQKWLKIGTTITLISSIVFFALCLINKKYRLLNNKIILIPLFVIYCLLSALLILKVYFLL